MLEEMGHKSLPAPCRWGTCFHGERYLNVCFLAFPESCTHDFDVLSLLIYNGNKFNKFQLVNNKEVMQIQTPEEIMGSHTTLIYL